VKTAISIPDDVFRRAEAAARRLGVSRSELFTRAVVELLKAYPEDELKESYDQAFGEAETDATLAEHRRRAARAALKKIEWR
jgi:metal-responsive CopG/Arc/MetJ family transcriptional regulator